jgi:hypothetical protein
MGEFSGDFAGGSGGGCEGVERAWETGHRRGFRREGVGNSGEGYRNGNGLRDEGCDFRLWGRVMEHGFWGEGMRGFW